MSDNVDAAPARGTRPRNRRDLVIAAAAELFVSDGYANVSMNDIAKAVNVRPSALYRHFSGKQEILREAISRGARLRQDAVALGEDHSLDEILEDLASSAMETRRSSVLWTMEVRNLDADSAQEIRREFRALPTAFAERLAALRPDLDPSRAEVLAWAALDVLASIAFHEEKLSASALRRVLREAMDRIVTAEVPAELVVPPTCRGVDRPVRREALLRASADLFARRGFPAVTLDDIGAAVGMAGPGLYASFASKQQLLEALLRRSVDWLEYRTRMDLTEDQGAAERLGALLDAYIDFTHAEPSLASLLLTETQHAAPDLAEQLDQVERESVNEWTDLLRSLDGELDTAVARVQVQAARMVVLDALTTASLRSGDELVGLVRLAARAVLGLD